MAFPIIPKKRSGATGSPTSLTVGELAVNTATGELFLGGDDAVLLLNPPTAAGTTATERTGDGTTTAFTFTGYNGTADGGYLVSVGGIDQPPSKYAVTSTAGGTITFVEAPTAGELISIRALVASGGGGGGGGTVTSITAGAGLEGGTITDSGTISMPDVGTPQTAVGSGLVIPVISTDAQGRVTALTTVACPALTTTQIAGLATTTPAALSTTAIAGLSTFAARADHAHLLPSAADVGALGATASASGDLTGTYPGPTLAAITTAQSNVGSSTVVPVLSIDAKGRVTALSTAAISAPAGFTVAALQTQSLTIDATFAQKIIPFSASTGVQVTLPSDANASIALGTEIKIANTGASEVGFLPGSGATLTAPGNLTSITSQYGAAVATKLFPNTWLLGGSLAQGSFVDPYYSSVSLLLHMNGADGGTSFPDNSSNVYTVTPFGGAATSTTQVKFGTASYLGASGRYLTVSSDNTPFAFGTGDFTMEFWIRPTAFTSQQNLIVFSNLTASAIIVSSSGFCIYQLSNVNRITSTALTLNAWSHIAVSRVSGVTRMFVSGILQTTAYADTTNYLATGALWQIGGAAAPLIGNIDDLRITKGVGRYISNFTAPISEFPNS